jgi:hypothetical protein
MVLDLYQYPSAPLCLSPITFCDAWQTLSISRAASRAELNYYIVGAEMTNYQSLSPNIKRLFRQCV